MIEQREKPDVQNVKASMKDWRYHPESPGNKLRLSKPTDVLQKGVIDRINIIKSRAGLP